MNNGIVGLTPGLGDYSPLPQGAGSWGGNRGRFHTDEIRLFGYGDSQRNWLANAGTARLINTNPSAFAGDIFFPGDIAMVSDIGSGTITCQGAPPFAAAYNVAGRYRQAGTGGGTVAFENNTICDNLPGFATQVVGMAGLTSTTFYIANGAACTLPGVVDITSLPAVGTFNSGTMTGSVVNYSSAFQVGTGATVTTRSAYKVGDTSGLGAGPLATAGSGTLTNQYGLDIPIMNFASTVNTAIRIGAGGQTFTTLPPSPGQIDVYTGTTTLNMGVGNNALPPVLNCGGTIALSSNGGSFGTLTFFDVHPVITNTVGTSPNFTGVNGYLYGPTYTANTQTGLGCGTQIGYLFAPTTSIANAGTMTSGVLQGMSAGATIGTGTTITTYQGLLVSTPTITGTLTTWIGVDIQATTAAGTNIGIRNASPTVNTPSSTQTCAAATTIAPNATVVLIQQTGGSNITFSSTPTITAGQNGQVLYIVNNETASSNGFIFTSNSSLAGSNLSLGAATRTVGVKGSLTLIYSTALTRWVEIGFNAGTLG